MRRRARLLASLQPSRPNDRLPSSQELTICTRRASGELRLELRRVRGCAPAFRRGCRTKPRRPHWSLSKGGVRRAETRFSDTAPPVRQRRAQLLQWPSQRTQPRFSQTTLCDSLRPEQASQGCPPRRLHPPDCGRLRWAASRAPTRARRRIGWVGPYSLTEPPSPCPVLD